MCPCSSRYSMARGGGSTQHVLRCAVVLVRDQCSRGRPHEQAIVLQGTHVMGRWRTGMGLCLANRNTSLSNVKTCAVQTYDPTHTWTVTPHTPLTVPNGWKEHQHERSLHAWSSEAEATNKREFRRGGYKQTGIRKGAGLYVNGNSVGKIEIQPEKLDPRRPVGSWPGHGSLVSKQHGAGPKRDIVW